MSTNAKSEFTCLRIKRLDRQTTITTASLALQVHPSPGWLGQFCLPGMLRVYSVPRKSMWNQDTRCRDADRRAQTKAEWPCGACILMSPEWDTINLARGSANQPCRARPAPVPARQ
ncbi:hypothetical protein M0657_005417 [Pyricularia oryzae]|uniref:Uncharacterized protein n=1 Tax=Pyricularia oryzae TaxID=318829 RepID=A0A4P7NSZ4_PYROR|nr:hypothetical protein M9X92_007804 [Pyricularia oryzae]KAI7922798.1 hypothetical protein M0657_005417 [Pyricularia oryzae]QBZ65625.1 hypothetical protein PoMZ_12588 [Pyricularia oryzae]